MTLTALCAAALLMTACDKGPTAPPMPSVAPVAGGDSSVPSATSVMTPAKAAEPAASAARTNDGLTRAQQSIAMPMAGQNNDHSAPLAAGKGASSPK